MPKYDSVREMRYLRYDKIYSGNIRLKKSRKAGQKQTPQRFCGDLFITGGARNLLPLAYERPAPDIRTERSKTGKNREFLQKTVFLGNFYTTQTRTHPQIFGIFTIFHTKIPYKNNREFFGTYQGFIRE